jgi:hypothetical protein
VIAWCFLVLSFLDEHHPLSRLDGTSLEERVLAGRNGELSSDAFSSDMDKFDGTQTTSASNTASASLTPKASIVSLQSKTLLDPSNKAWAIPLITVVSPLLLLCFFLSLYHRYAGNRQKEHSASKLLTSVFKSLWMPQPWTILTFEAHPSVAIMSRT